MAKYSEGDVVLVHFPYIDNEGVPQCKSRPGVIVHQSDHNEYLTVQITSKNRSRTNKGIWVLKDSPEGVQMGLLADSYINIDQQTDLNIRDIKRKIGDCPFMEKIHELRESNT